MFQAIGPALRASTAVIGPFARETARITAQGALAGAGAMLILGGIVAAGNKTAEGIEHMHHSISTRWTARRDRRRLHNNANTAMYAAYRDVTKQQDYQYHGKKAALYAAFNNATNNAPAPEPVV